MAILKFISKMEQLKVLNRVWQNVKGGPQCLVGKLFVSERFHTATSHVC